MTVEGQITINASRNNVWTAISDIRHAAEIIKSVEKIEILHEPASGLVGLKWRETRMYFGKPAAIDKWITAAVENTQFETQSEMDGFVFITTMVISESGDQIRLTSTHKTIAQGIVAKIKSLPMVFFKGMLRKVILQDLGDIKKRAEHS